MSCPPRNSSECSWCICYSLIIILCPKEGELLTLRLDPKGKGNLMLHYIDLTIVSKGKTKTRLRNFYDFEWSGIKRLSSWVLVHLWALIFRKTCSSKIKSRLILSKNKVHKIYSIQSTFTFIFTKVLSWRSNWPEKKSLIYSKQGMEILRCNLITDSLFLLLWSFLPLMDIVMGKFQFWRVCGKNMFCALRRLWMNFLFFIKMLCSKI